MFIRLCVFHDLIFKFVPCFEHPCDDGDAQAKEHADHNHARGEGYVRAFVKAPSKTADEIHNRIEKRNCLPYRREHVDGIKASAQKGKGGND